MAANRRRSVSGMLILRGTTTRNPGAANDLAKQQLSPIQGKTSREFFLFLKETGRALDRVASSPGDGNSQNTHRKSGLLFRRSWRLARTLGSIARPRPRFERCPRVNPSEGGAGRGSPRPAF